MLPTLLGPVHIGTSSTSHSVIDVYTGTYAVTGHVSLPCPTQYTKCIAPQGRQPNFQPHYDVPRNNHTDDSVRKFKLDAPKFDGMIESTTFLD